MFVPIAIQVGLLEYGQKKLIEPPSPQPSLPCWDVPAIKGEGDIEFLLPLREKARMRGIYVAEGHSTFYS